MRRINTGYRDTNGVTIYVGDIVRFGDEGDIGAVERVERKFVITYHDAIIEEFDNEPECEIIGNIKTNPELLEDADE